jgi:hypothetical protein
MTSQDNVSQIKTVDHRGKIISELVQIATRRGAQPIRLTVNSNPP